MILVLLAGFSCADAPQVGGVAPPDLSIEPPRDLAFPSYPAGPYGMDLGQLVPDFHFQGYLRAGGRSLSFGDVSLDDLRRTGARYLLIATGAFW